MSMKIVAGVVFALIATVAYAKTYTGSVSLSLYPSIEEFAKAYAESEEPDLEKTASELIASRIQASKGLNIANKAVIELQTVPGFKTIRKAVVVDNQSFKIEHMDDDPECRVFCRLEVKGNMLTATTFPMVEDAEHYYCRSMKLRNDHTSVIGRCVDTNGMPVINAMVRVDLVRTPVEVDEGWMHQPLIGRTDAKGHWRVDEIENPLFYDTISRICNTNIVNRPNSTVPPFGLAISACFEEGDSVVNGHVEVPNITARDRAAAERIFAAYKRKTGKDWPRIAPMTDFPASTNNVIYVPDLVLK